MKLHVKILYALCTALTAINLFAATDDNTISITLKNESGHQMYIVEYNNIFMEKGNRIVLDNKETQTLKIHPSSYTYIQFSYYGHTNRRGNNKRNYLKYAITYFKDGKTYTITHPDANTFEIIGSDGKKLNKA